MRELFRAVIRWLTWQAIGLVIAFTPRPRVAPAR